MSKEEIEREIRNTLRGIFTYIGGIDHEYSNHATLQTMLKRLIEKTKR